MEKLRTVVNEIAYSQDRSELSSLHRSLIPLLAFASSAYGLASSLRRYAYRFGVFSKHRLPLPVISVGNLTWGGNGKTPMVEFIAASFADAGISPLILTRGYAGGDEVRMLQRHLLGKLVKVGVGANRAETAASFIKKYGYYDLRCGSVNPVQKMDQGTSRSSKFCSEEIGAVILDDGMQHWPLFRDLDIIMVNGLRPWGNCQLVPLGPMRETLAALGRADIVVIHNAELVSKQNLERIKYKVREVKKSIRIFFTRMAPAYFFEVGKMGSVVPLEEVTTTVVLCVSAIGSADAFVKGIEKLGPVYVERLDFSDHHSFQTKDIQMIISSLKEMEIKYCCKPIVIVTEKDYDRDPEILNHLLPYRTWVLCAKLQFVPYEGCSEIYFRNSVEELVGVKLSVVPDN